MKSFDELLQKHRSHPAVDFLVGNSVSLNFVLHDYLLEAHERLPEDKFTPHFLKLMESVVFFYQKYLSIPDSIERVKAFHSDVDEIISRDLFGPSGVGNQLLCTKGCSSCCSQPLSVTASEVKLLKLQIAENKLILDRQRLKRQQGVGIERWTVVLTEDQGKCVFLNPEDGTCRVWSQRPANCRNYFVSGSNSYCSVFNRDPDRSLSHKSILADACISAFYSLDGGSATLADSFTDDKD